MRNLVAVVVEKEPVCHSNNHRVICIFDDGSKEDIITTPTYDGSAVWTLTLENPIIVAGAKACGWSPVDYLYTLLDKPHRVMYRLAKRKNEFLLTRRGYRG